MQNIVKNIKKNEFILKTFSNIVFSVRKFSIFFFLSSLFLYLITKYKNLYIKLGIIVLLIFDLYLSGAKYVNLISLEKSYPTECIAKFLKKENSHFRVLLPFNALQNNFIIWGIETPDGYEANILRRYSKFMNFSESRELDHPQEDIRIKKYSKLIYLLNVKYILLYEKYEPSKIILDVNTNKECFLIVSDSYYPGWKAYINGKKSKIYKTNFIFRGIILKRGKNSIEFSYKPFSFYIGTILSFITLLITLKIFVKLSLKKS